MFSVSVKDTRHGERLGEGVEGRAPGDLPGSDVCDDELQLQIQVNELQPEQHGHGAWSWKVVNRVKQTDCDKGWYSIKTL